MEWISVKDRLPKDEEEVSYTFDGIEVRDDILWDQLTQKWNRFECSCNRWEVEYVTHWMPMPTPPLGPFS